MRPTRRPSARKAERLPNPGMTRPKAERGEFPYRNDNSADPNAAPNGGRRSVNIASAFGKPKNGAFG